MDRGNQVCGTQLHVIAAAVHGVLVLVGLTGRVRLQPSTCTVCVCVNGCECADTVCMCCPSCAQSAALASWEEKLTRQRDDQEQQRQELEQSQEQAAEQEAANSAEAERLQGLQAELEAGQAAVAAREAAAAAHEQQLAADAAALEGQHEELLRQVAEVQVRAVSQAVDRVASMCLPLCFHPCPAGWLCLTQLHPSMACMPVQGVRMHPPQQQPFQHTHDTSKDAPPLPPTHAPAGTGASAPAGPDIGTAAGGSRSCSPVPYWPLGCLDGHAPGPCQHSCRRGPCWALTYSALWTTAAAATGSSGGGRGRGGQQQAN